MLEDFIAPIRPYMASERQSLRLATVSACFWTSSMILQQIFGRCGIHSGLPRILMTSIGLASASSCMALSFAVTDSILPTPKNLLRKQRFSRIELIQNTLIGVAVFSLLERKMFSTMLPSSVLTTGVYTPIFFKNRFSIPTIDPVASAPDRLKIQSFGRSIGCHHCGTRQLFSKANFIADHMPPTKVINEMNRKLWRKMLGWKVTQRLYPQCQTCFSLQGAAVKAGKHSVIYHPGKLSASLAPAAALTILNNSPKTKEFFRNVAESIYNWKRK